MTDIAPRNEEPEDLQVDKIYKGSIDRLLHMWGMVRNSDNRADTIDHTDFVPSHPDSLYNKCINLSEGEILEIVDSSTKKVRYLMCVLNSYRTIVLAELDMAIDDMGAFYFKATTPLLQIKKSSDKIEDKLFDGLNQKYEKTFIRTLSIRTILRNSRFRLNGLGKWRETLRSASRNKP